MRKPQCLNSSTALVKSSSPSFSQNFAEFYSKMNYSILLYKVLIFKIKLLFSCDVIPCSHILLQISLCYMIWAFKTNLMSCRRGTHPQCFMCGGLSILTASFILKSESWLFLGTTILCSSGDFELLDVGYNITCKGQTMKSCWSQWQTFL